MTLEVRAMLREVAKDLAHFGVLYGADAFRLAAAVFAVTAAAGLPFRCAFGKERGRGWLRRAAVLSLLAAYGYMAAGITLLFRARSEAGILNLELFSTFQDDFMSRKYICENVLLLFPCAVLLYLLGGMFRRVWVSLPAGLCVSLMIETVQLQTRLGKFEADDILTNMTGYAAGYLLCRAADCVFRAVKKGIGFLFSRRAGG